MSKSLKRFASSIRHAWRGLSYVWKHELNFKLQVVIGLCALILGFVLEIRRLEMLVIVLLIFSILALEVLNSALERFIDVFKPRMHKHVGLVKDVMAGVVLLVSLGALIVGLLIYGPPIIELLKSA